MTLPYRETVIFSGHVQGVGFRYAALQVAREFEVAGKVSNLADGRVELDVEGSREEVFGYIAAVEERMHGYIRKTERVRPAVSGNHQGFVIG